MDAPPGMKMEVFWLDDKELGAKCMALGLLASSLNEELLRHAVGIGQEGGSYEIFESEQAGGRFPTLRLGWVEPWASTHVALAIRNDILALGFGANKKMRTRAAHLALAVHEAAVYRSVPSSLAEGHGKQLVGEARKMLNAARQEAFPEPAKRENGPSQGLKPTTEVEVDESCPKAAPREEVRHFVEPYTVFKTSNDGWLIAGPMEDFWSKTGEAKYVRKEGII